MPEVHTRMAEFSIELIPDAKVSIYLIEERKIEIEALKLKEEEERMSGLFSLFSSGRTGQQATQTSTDEREAQVEKGDPLATTSHCGIEVDIEFRPVEHPVEPISQDRPIKCPLFEPSILNDGRIWKEMISSTISPLKADIVVVKKGGTNLNKESGGRRHRSAPRSRPPSLSAPGDGILKLLEECKVDGDRTAGS